MTETGARTVSGIALGLVGIFLIAVVVTGLQSSGFSTPASETAAAGAPAGGSAVAASGGNAAGGGDAVHGKQLFQQFNCGACHSVNGMAGVGPSLKGVAGAPVPLIDGTSVTADDAYLKVAIQQPNAQIVQGYMANVMSSGITAYQDQLNKDDVTAALIAYIKTLK